MAGLWTIVLYKLISVAETISLFIIVGYGIGKAWPHVVKLLNE